MLRRHLAPWKARPVAVLAHADLETPLGDARDLALHPEVKRAIGVQQSDLHESGAVVDHGVASVLRQPRGLLTGHVFPPVR